VKEVRRSKLVRKLTVTCGSKECGVGLKHGLCGTSEYLTWGDMCSRCTNINHHAYADYGGRGISVCNRWLNSFEDFLTDVGRRPSAKFSLDRFPDKNGNYEPGNVRWATSKQQQRNTRSNRLLTYNGETKCVAEWAEETGIPGGTILRLGWSTEKILTTPIDTRFRSK
jgi:hypothetical protein